MENDRFLCLQMCLCFLVDVDFVVLSVFIRF